MDIISLLHITREKGASDLHLVTSSPPVLRINGALQQLSDMPELTPEDTEQAFNQLTSAKEKEVFASKMELDFGYTLPGIGRFRCNAARQRGTASMAIRLLSLKIPALDTLGVPDVCKELVVKPRGLVIISGPTGSGKSTTLAGMIDYLSSVRDRRVVTIEDPIEYIYTNHRCTITQRELGSDTESFAEALRHVLRQDPDVILVGEMRDLDTAAAVLTTAETGHLVLSTGHAPSSSQAIERVIDLFPPHERPLAQARLASLLLGILCQTLIPKIDGSGRVAAVEVMLANPAVKNLIREGKIHQIPNIMRTHSHIGMELLDHCLVRLYNHKQISFDSILEVCNDRDEVNRLIEHARGNGIPVQSEQEVAA